MNGRPPSPLSPIAGSRPASPLPVETRGETSLPAAAASAPASRHASRPTTPIKLKVKAASAPASRRNSFVRRTPRSTNQKLAPIAPADVLLRRNFSATIGTARTGRGELPPTDCRVHAYADSDAPLSQRRGSFSATFGKASVGRGLTPRATPTKLPALPTGSGLIGREAVGALQPHTFHATFGSAPQRPAPISGGAAHVHAYADADGANPRLPLKHVPHACFGNAPQRPAPPSSAIENRVHAYADAGGANPGLPLKHTPQAHFGTAPQRSQRPSSGATRPHAYDGVGGLALKHTPQAHFGTAPRFGTACAHLGWRPAQTPLGLPMQPAIAA